MQLGRQAKVITPALLKKMQAYARATAQPRRDLVIVLLSAKAGLRACEIAGLTWAMACEANGKVGESLAVPSRIAKKQSGRRIPIHPDLRKALVRLKLSHGLDLDLEAPIVPSKRGGFIRPNSIVNWFVAMFAEIGAEGCSSHSGRRTFITSAARNVHRTGGSLRDVQILAGHRSIETTQRYIDGDTAGQKRLVHML